MFYLAIAAVAYVATAFQLVREETPETFGQALGTAVRCAFTALFWLPVLVWRLLRGPAGFPGLRNSAYDQPWESRGDSDLTGWYWSASHGTASERSR